MWNTLRDSSIPQVWQAGLSLGLGCFPQHWLPPTFPGHTEIPNRELSPSSFCPVHPNKSPAEPSLLHHAMSAFRNDFQWFQGNISTQTQAILCKPPLRLMLNSTTLYRAPFFLGNYRINCSYYSIFIFIRFLWKREECISKTSYYILNLLLTPLIFAWISTFPSSSKWRYNTHQQQSHLLPPDTTQPQRGDTKMGEHLQNHKKLGVSETSGSQTFQLQVLLEHFTEHKPGDCSREGRSHQSTV